MKAVLKLGVSFVNVKRISDNVILAAIRWKDNIQGTVSDAVYGEEVDGIISGFNKIYKADGSIYELHDNCYAPTTNLFLSNDLEPGVPTPTPIPTPYPDHLIVAFPDGVVKRYDLSQ